MWVRLDMAFWKTSQMKNIKICLLKMHRKMGFGEIVLGFLMAAL